MVACSDSGGSTNGSVADDNDSVNGESSVTSQGAEQVDVEDTTSLTPDSDNGSAASSVRAACNGPNFDINSDTPFPLIDLASFDQASNLNNSVSTLEQAAALSQLTAVPLAFTFLPFVNVVCSYAIYEAHACSTTFDEGSVLTNVSLVGSELSFTLSAVDGTSSTSVMISDPFYSRSSYTTTGTRSSGRFVVSRADDGTETFDFVSSDSSSTTKVIEFPDCSGTVSSTSPEGSLDASWASSRLPSLSVDYNYCYLDDGAITCTSGQL